MYRVFFISLVFAILSMGLFLRIETNFKKSTKSDQTSNFYIKISQKKLEKLYENIPEITSSNFPLCEKDCFSYEKAEMIFNDKKYKIEIKPRGALPNHWKNQKKSWTIKLLGNKTINGRTKFKFIIPSDRNFFQDLLMNHRAKKMGLMTPSNKFARLYFNKKYEGFYYLVEDWDKPFLETNSLSADADFFADIYGDVNYGYFYKIFNSVGLWKKLSIDPQKREADFSSLGFLLKLIQNQDQFIINLVDIENFIAWNAHSVLSNDNHQNNYGNLRLYFDKTRGNFQFIPWDVQLYGYAKKSVIDRSNNTLSNLLLSNPQTFFKRNQKLWNYVNNPENLKEDLNYYDNLSKKNEFLWKEEFKITRKLDAFKNPKEVEKIIKDTRSLYEHNINYIKNTLSKSTVFVDIQKNSSGKKYDLAIKINSPAGVFFQGKPLLPKRIVNDKKIFYEGIYQFKNMAEKKESILKILDKEFVNIFSKEKVPYQLKTFTKTPIKNTLETFFPEKKSNKSSQEMRNTKYEVSQKDFEARAFLTIYKKINKELLLSFVTQGVYDLKFINNSIQHLFSLKTNKKIKPTDSIFLKNIAFVAQDPKAWKKWGLEFFSQTELVTNDTSLFRNTKDRFEIRKNNEKRLKDLTIRFVDFNNFQYFYEIVYSKSKFLKANPFFKSLEKNKISLSGNHEITKNIIIPQTVELIIQPNTNLLMKEDVSIVSYGKVIAQGTKKAPITIKAKDSQKPFGVFALANEKASTSRFKNFHIEHGSEAIINGIYFSGMFSAYHNNDVLIEDSYFGYSHSDDGLNFKYSNSKVLNSTFEKNSADAIDFDFMSGEINGNKFLENGNDAIDTSGSTTLIQNNYIYKSRDKGMSFGEKSKTIVINNILDSCFIGIACKDLTTSIFINNSIINNQTAVNTYKKKAFFGPAHCEFYNSIFANNKQEIVFENAEKDDEKKEKEASKITIQNSILTDQAFKQNRNIIEKISPKNSDERKGDLKKLKEFLPKYSKETVNIGIYDRTKIPEIKK